MSYSYDAKAKYAKSHEWARIEGKIAVIGVSDYAQHLLSDVVYVELPEVGDTVTKGESLGTVESVKAAEDAYSPISGEVVEINSRPGRQSRVGERGSLRQGVADQGRAERPRRDE